MIIKHIPGLKKKKMMAFLFFLLTVPIVTLFLLPKYTKNGEKLHPPGPPGLPIIGNLHQLDNSNLYLYLWQLSKKYGPLMSMRLGLKPTLVVSSARMAKEVLKTHDLTFCSKPGLKGLKKLSYNCRDVAFSPCNDYWMEMRKICVLHLFSSKRVQSFRPVREDEVCRMIRKISRLASSSKAINLSEILVALTSTIICRVAFGKRFDDEGNQRRRLYGLLSEAQAVMGSFYVSDYFPSTGWVDKLFGMCTRLEKSFNELDLFYQELIDEHLDPNRPNSTQENILDILLQLRNDQSSSIDLTLDHIKAVLMNIITGTDTSAATVIWTLTGLMKHPKTMMKVQEEIRSVIEKKGIVDEDDVAKLPYLKAVIKESMRWRPPIALILRETLKKCLIYGYEIPAKTLVYINTWAIGRDPESWDNPEEFLPERFLNSSIDFKGNDFELIAFGAGRRVCPGMSLGTVMVELTLVNLLYSFDWKLPNGMSEEDLDTDVSPGLTMHKKNPLFLLAKKYI